MTDNLFLFVGEYLEKECGDCGYWGGCCEYGAAAVGYTLLLFIIFALFF
jgi:hypothetical protein